MASTTIPQFLLPRGIPSSTLRLLASRHAVVDSALTRPMPMVSQRRLASSQSSSTAPKAFVLEKPDKFRPPSHPQRRVLQAKNNSAGPRNYPGPALSEKEKEEQRTKRYPNMFPPEGTLMYRFLTNRGIHIWISMGVLLSLATFTMTTTFKQTSPFAHLLPSWSELLTHPIQTVTQVLHVYRLHTEHASRETAEKRKARVDDVEKRRLYRVAHGLEEDLPQEERSAVPDGGDEASPAAAAAVGAGPEFTDWEGRKRPVKKWLGIW